jgi:hypothetical protein
MLPYFHAHGKFADCEAALKAITYCRKIRNRYAHCSWAHDQRRGARGLYYVDLQESAASTEFFHYGLHVNSVVLEGQVAYLKYTRLLLRTPFKTLVRRGIGDS